MHAPDRSTSRLLRQQRKHLLPIGSPQSREAEDNQSQVGVVAIEERNWHIEYGRQPCERTQVRLMFAALILIDPRACREVIDARLNTELLLRYAGANPRLLQPFCDYRDLAHLLPQSVVVGAKRFLALLLTRY